MRYTIVLKLQVQKVERYAESAQPESGLFAARFIPEGQLAAFYRAGLTKCTPGCEKFWGKLGQKWYTTAGKYSPTWEPLFSPPLYSGLIIPCDVDFFALSARLLAMPKT